MDIKITLANNRRNVILKQYKLNKAKTDLKKKDPKVTSVIYYNNSDNVLVGYNDGNLKKTDSVSGLRAQTLTDTTIKSDGSKLSCRQINNMDRKYRRVWQYEGETYGVKPGKIERLENGVGGREITNVYDIKGWDLYDSKTKYRSDLTTMWGYPDLSYTNNFRINFVQISTRCYSNQKSVLNLFFNSKEQLYSIQVFYQNKYTEDTIKYYTSNIFKGTNSTFNDAELCTIMKMKRPAIIVGKKFNRNKRAYPNGFNLIKFEAVNIFDNRRFSQYYRGFQYLSGDGVGLWRPELHKFIYRSKEDTGLLFGSYHPELMTLRTGSDENWAIAYLLNNTKYYNYYRDFMCDGCLLLSIDGHIFNNDFKNLYQYFTKYIDWTDISFNSGCCYAREESNVWNSIDNNLNDIRGPYASNGGGGALTEEEINYLRFELNAQEIFNTDDFKNWYNRSIDDISAWYFGPFDLTYRQITFNSIVQNVFNTSSNGFTTFDSFMKHLSSIGNNDAWIHYNQTGYEAFRNFFADIFNDIRYIRTMACVYHYLDKISQSGNKCASKLMKLINVIFLKPGEEYGQVISGYGYMVFGKYMYLGY